MTVGHGPSPSGVTTNAWIRWPSGRLEPEPATRSPGSHRFAGRSDHGPSVVRHDRRNACRFAAQEPHDRVGSDRGTQDLARSVVDERRRPRPGVDPHQLIRPLELVTGQDGRAVGPPPDGDHGARKIDRQIVPLSAREIPDRRAFERASFGREEQSMVAGDRAPRDGIEVRSLVDLLADGFSGRHPTTRSASWTMSPCSECRRQIKRPSAESPPDSCGIEAPHADRRLGPSGRASQSHPRR